MTLRTQRTRLFMAAVGLSLAIVLAGPMASIAEHESDNELTFEAVTGSPSPAGSGTGAIEFDGGAEPDSRWTIKLQFTALQPETDYVAVVQGRFGEDGSSESTEFTPLCAIRTDATGDGGCWYYLVGLRRLGVVQVRLGDPSGQAVLQSTRGEDGPGSMTSTTTVHSLSLTATPWDNATASPVATPEASGGRRGA